MNDSTVKLIEALAAKLGTTAEYLWESLLRQAPVSATGDLLLIAVEGVCAFLMVRWYRHICRERIDEIVFLPYGVAAIVLCVSAAVSIGSLPITFAGFFNPEYWALREVLSFGGE